MLVIGGERYLLHQQREHYLFRLRLEGGKSYVLCFMCLNDQFMFDALLIDGKQLHVVKGVHKPMA